MEDFVQSASQYFPSWAIWLVSAVSALVALIQWTSDAVEAAGKVKEAAVAVWQKIRKHARWRGQDTRPRQTNRLPLRTLLWAIAGNLVVVTAFVYESVADQWAFAADQTDPVIIQECYDNIWSILTRFALPIAAIGVAAALVMARRFRLSSWKLALASIAVPSVVTASWYGIWAAMQ